MSTYQTDFTPEEFAERRARVFDAIGDRAVAVLQGAPTPPGFDVFRQTNEFYYLCGVEEPHAYLLLDARERKTTLYLPGYSEGRERSEGAHLHADDPETVKSLTGMEEVLKADSLAAGLAGAEAIFVPWGPGEGARQSRGTARNAERCELEDPWRGRPSAAGLFIDRLKSRCPQAAIRDLSPVLDSLRIVKSPAEIKVMRKAGRLTALAVAEAMRSTQPGATEYQLRAIADYIFLANGARGAGYCAILASGTNAWHGHYHRNDSPLKDGDLVLMDYAPDCGNYTSDIGRMWPVNGKYAPWQRELYGLMVEYQEVLLDLIRPGVMAAQIHQEAAERMRKVVDSTRFPKPCFEESARRALEFQGHLSHSVGMAVHDVGTYKTEPIRPGNVFSVDAQMWVPEEKLYVRCEDTVAVTQDGIENLTALAPLCLDDVEATMKEEGLLQRYPPERDL